MADQPAGIVRAAVPADLPQILEIESLCFEKPWPEANFRAALYDVFIVYEHERIWGFIVACSNDITRHSMIMKVAVHPQARGRGVASLLMSRTLAALRENRIACVALSVEIAKTNVQRLYEKFGFQTLTVLNPDVDYEDEAFYEMQLCFPHTNQD
jgi:[ribosomal protein S18]-alanine N-acetyltransferase